MNIITNDESTSLLRLTGGKPILDTFIGTLSITKVQSPSRFEEWFKTIRIYPAFIFYKGGSFYRIFGIHNLLENPAENGISDSVLHVAIYKYDFMLNFLSKKSFFQSDFYEYIPVFITFFPSDDIKEPPIGGQWVEYNNSFYLRLFHHTTKNGKEGIIRDRTINASHWNFAGTRKIALSYCYFTDMQKIENIFDSLPLLLRKSEGTDILLRTDDENHIIKCGIKVDNRKLDERINVLIKSDLIQPNPVIMHHPINGQDKWLEIEFQRIFRIPCNSIKLKNIISFEGEEHWLIDENCINDFRTTDPILIADGNIPKNLYDLINENYPI